MSLSASVSVWYAWWVYLFFAVRVDCWFYLIKISAKHDCIFDGIFLLLWTIYKYIYHLTWASNIEPFPKRTKWREMWVSLPLYSPLVVLFVFFCLPVITLGDVDVINSSAAGVTSWRGHIYCLLPFLTKRQANKQTTTTVGVVYCAECGGLGERQLGGPV